MIYEIITGYMPKAVFMAALIFAFCGFLFHKIIKWRTSKARKKTTEKFNFAFWVKDNIAEAIAHAFVLFLAVRFAPDLLRYVAPQSVEFFQSADKMLVYVAIGWIVAYPISWFKKKFKK
jgi:hypothetical protein